MRVTAARFETAATTLAGLPAAGLPEVAVAGRSNVGKSSFVNVLLGRRGLARTSRTPGRTRQLNFFVVNEVFRLVDFPGFGYAAGPEAERRSWGQVIEGYLRLRTTLCGVLVLVDVRRGMQADEEMLLDFLEHVERASALVVTKFDKVGRGVGARTLAAVRGGRDVPTIGFSATAPIGRAEVWRVVHAWLAAGPRGTPEGDA